MASVNKVILVGNLGKDPETRKWQDKVAQQRGRKRRQRATRAASVAVAQRAILRPLVAVSTTSTMTSRFDQET